MHHIKVSNFGPIIECDMDINKFNVLTGPQASGKSTIAKAIYFFRTIKNDILDLILKNKTRQPLKEVLKDHLTQKLRSLYDRFTNDFILKYIYGEDSFVEISLNQFDKEIFKFGGKIEKFLDCKNKLPYNVNDDAINSLSEELNDLFNDDMETVYIPAGRITISLLSEQLTPVFFSMDDTQRRTIDYSFWKYFELVLKIRPYFEKINIRYKGMAGFYKKIIKAEYKYENLQERLYFNDDDYIILNFASSGQQEAVWILNILNYFYAENKKIFLVVEEPEAHLYPEAQMHMTDALALFVNGGGNSGLIATHSPYILGEFNNLILCGQASHDGIDKKDIKEASDADERAWFKKGTLQAFHAINGKCENALTESGLIMNELIEGASEKIDDRCSGLIDLFHGEGNK